MEINYNLNNFFPLEINEYRGHRYQISFNWNFPAAYIEVDKLLNDNECNFPVHGGITFCVKNYKEKRSFDDIVGDGKCYYGWNYGHALDYMCFPGLYENNGKKWTIEEIRQQCMDAIDYYIKRIKDENL